MVSKVSKNKSPNWNAKLTPQTISYSTKNQIPKGSNSITDNGTLYNFFICYYKPFFLILIIVLLSKFSQSATSDPEVF